MAPELPDAYPSRVLDNRNLEQLGEQLDGIIEVDGVNTERVDIPIWFRNKSAELGIVL